MEHVRVHRPVGHLIPLILLATSCAAAQEGEVVSLAPNPSFEQGAGEEPADWSYYSWQDSRGWWDTEHAHTGARSLGLEGPNGGWSTVVPVTPGAVYTLSLHYRAEGGPSRVTVFVRYPVGVREMQSLLYLPTPTIPADRQGQFVDGVWVGGADEEGWVQADIGDFRAPEGEDAVSLLIKLTSDNPVARLWLDDVIVTAAEVREVADTARLLAKFPAGVLWTDSENAKILPDREPPAGEPLDAVRLSAARGEFESFQLAVTPTNGAQAVDFAWGDLSGPRTLSRDALRVRRIECVDIQRAMGPYGHQGLNPDALTEMLPVDIPAGVNQGFWFTLQVPEDQPPGDYEGELALTVGDEAVVTVPLRLHLHDFAIPARPSLNVRSNVRFNLVLEREAGDPDEIMRRYYEDVYGHRSRCAPGVQPRVRVQDGRVELDAAEYIEHLVFMRDELGATRFDIPSLWIGHGGDHLMPRDAQWRGIAIFANDALTELNPEFEVPFREYMGRLVAALRDAGVFLEPSVRFIDEPRLDDEPTRNGIRALSELLLDIEPELQIANTVSSPHPELLDVTHQWVLHTDAWDRSVPQIEMARAAGDAILVYNNAVNYPEHNPIRVRLWPWLLRAYAVDGTYSWWGTVCWRGDVADPWSAGAGSSGVLMYPPRTPDERGPIDSVRWELFREGLEDYEYMEMAADLAQRLEDAGNADAARIGREAIDRALSLVERWPVVRTANDQPYTLDVTAVDDAREALAAAIEQMQDAL